MVRAVGAGELGRVKQFLAEGADPNTVMRYLDEPYESQGISPRALWIRITGAPGAPRKLNGPTALMKAVETNNTQMVRLLLDHGANVQAVGWYGDTALSEATQGTTKKPEIVRMLREAGAKK